MGDVQLEWVAARFITEPPPKERLPDAYTKHTPGGWWSGGGTGGGDGGPGPCGANETGAHQGGAEETAET